MALRAIALLGAGVISTVSAHGHVQGIVIGGKYYPGYDFTYQYESPVPKVIGWSTPEVTDNGFVAPTAYDTPDIICHIGATPAGTSAKVAAGDTVKLEWTPWPDSHHGPVLDYLAKCPGSCSDVTKTDLEFFKISEGGLINDATPPGTWASDKLIAANNSWTVTIPSDIAPGNYVLRHEIIALHSAETVDGAQNYPQCFNLQVTGGGSATPSGESAEKFYTPKAKGILIDIYSAISKYVIPGPPVYGGGSGSSAPSSSAPAAASSSAVAVSSATPSNVAPSAPVQSAPATSYSAPAQSGGVSYSAPASSGSASSSGASSSAGAASASYSSSAYAASSSSKCTSTITIRSSTGAASASSSKPYSPPSSIPVSPAGSSSYPIPSGTAPSGPASTGGFSVPYPTGTSAPYPSSSVGAASGTSSYSAPPAPSASAPAGYPTPPPPSSGVDMEGLMAKIIKYIKQSFRQAEHAKDFKKF